MVGTDDLIVAFCEYGDEDSLQQIRMELSRSFLHHSALDLRRMDALPRTSNGKIDYDARDPDPMSMDELMSMPQYSVPQGKKSACCSHG